MGAGKAGIPQGARKVTQGRRGLNLQGRLPLWSRPIQVRPQRRPGHFAHGLGLYVPGVPFLTQREGAGVKGPNGHRLVRDRL